MKLQTLGRILKHPLLAGLVAVAITSPEVPFWWAAFDRFVVLSVRWAGCAWRATVVVQHPVLWAMCLLGLGCIVGALLRRPWVRKPRVMRLRRTVQRRRSRTTRVDVRARRRRACAA
jgi:hypothetical protein